MIVIPAVDLREGRCVRLREGRADMETVFSEDPVAMATQWAARGARRLHVVDLDGAFAGAPKQTALVAKIVAAVAPVPVEAGGGLRDVAAVESVLEAGARWAVVGTRALEPAFIDEIGRRFPQRVIVAVDARDGRVAVRGWVDLSDLTPIELALAVRERAGVAALLYTDISRDGTEQGPNVEATAELARRSGVPVLASGGVGSVAHIAALAAVADAGIEGVVIGRALYTGAVTLADALRAAAGGA
ncbi:MAG TPA: 1-(5-phosphoribosyl)-5-[(5-phosphoribosylamino)methylideneamino]imidazole-4-carboxamide isomerase [Methylomirabilota bacterium]|nr:1-(5-phosphoribosyl)-5-[(5-phosphoribosylamino)methylideneamino]imidazole-4-carboxamide isomerase [Methylomirabilota bacterium]